jgi:hypothetical protein
MLVVIPSVQNDHYTHVVRCQAQLLQSSVHCSTGPLADAFGLVTVVHSHRRYQSWTYWLV